MELGNGAEWVVAAAAVLGLSGGGALWLFNVSQKADAALQGVNAIRAERERDKIAYDRRLEKAEETAGSVRDLAGAVRHMGEMTALELKTLADKFGEHSAFMKEQIGEVRHSLKNTEAKVLALTAQVAKLN